MKNDYPDNFIKLSENILNDNQIDFLINLIDNSSSVKLTDREFWHPYKNKIRNDYQYTLNSFHPMLCEDINSQLYNKLLAPYIKDFSSLYRDSGEYLNGSIILQKTVPAGGYHTWHCENDGWIFKDRIFAWMIYLNDVEEGGETEFLYQKIRFKPKFNMGLIWPGGFTHTHRGNPPLSGNKYILTGCITPLHRGDVVNMNFS